MQTNLALPNKTVDYTRRAQEYALHRKVQLWVFEQLLKLSEISSRSKVLETGYCDWDNIVR